MLRLIVVIMCLSGARVAFAQKDYKEKLFHSVHIGYGGTASEHGSQPWWYRTSLNYELKVCSEKMAFFVFKVGTNIPITTRDYSQFSRRTTHIVPVMIGFYAGKGNFCFHGALGTALLVFDGKYKHVYIAASAFVGLKYQKEVDGFYMKFGLTPTVGNFQEKFPYTGMETNSQPAYYGSWCEVGIGYTLKKSK